MIFGIVHIQMALIALLVIGNIAIRIRNLKSLHLAFNVVLLAVIALLFLAMGLLPVSGTYLNVISANQFSSFMGFLFAIGMLLFNLVAYGHSENYGDISMLAGFSFAGMYLIATSVSLVTIFIGMELSAIPSVFMILLSKRSIEAAAKFFIMASISIAILSFAIVMLYGTSNTLALQEYTHWNLLAFVAFLFIAGLSFDASIFPFNALIPDVFQGAGAYIAGMLGGVSKKAGFAAFIQVMILVFIAYKPAFAVIAVLSLLTMLYGNVVALLQNNIKRLMAYSSISQAGYILIGIATASVSGIGASLFQIFAHLFLFMGAMALVSWLESRNRTQIDDMIGLNSENRLAAFAMSVFLLSMVGLPFTTGFVGKFLLFVGAINSGLLWLAIAGIINSAISLFYYAKIIMAMYADKAHAKHLPIDATTLAAVAICLAVTIIFGLYPGPIISLANGAALYLLH
ncbi:MAG: NADH-quinone oxidoreductase subunit N [Candidatus Micrarchaeota archaeon]|nr:NADH-quinone oxidoreductase subunit N [Candidatus Micrarchaeota archaeon]